MTNEEIEQWLHNSKIERAQAVLSYERLHLKLGLTQQQMLNTRTTENQFDIDYYDTTNQTDTEVNLKKEIEERLANPNLLDCQLIREQLLKQSVLTNEICISVGTITHMIIERGGYVYGK